MRASLVIYLFYEAFLGRHSSPMPPGPGSAGACGVSIAQPLSDGLCEDRIELVCAQLLA